MLNVKKYANLVQMTIKKHLLYLDHKKLLKNKQKS